MRLELLPCKLVLEDFAFIGHNVDKTSPIDSEAHRGALSIISGQAVLVASFNIKVLNRAEVIEVQVVLAVDDDLSGAA